ncbi:MAG: 2-oxoacid:acceptor oxidoreductase family protein [Candidatus Atribacteria bacterium]|nr:2-oxoacid:acceptor oxidoreductase family protein [Candidatus Atribacteria bacterium]
MKFKERGKIEIRFSGTGGQGLVLASIILAEALMMDGFNIITGESHGIEARGGASSAEIIASKEEIFDLSVTLPDILVTLSQQAYDKYGKKIKKDSLVILDSSLMKSESIADSENIHTLPLTRLVREELGTTLPTNICSLGALVGISKIVSMDSIKKAIVDRVPKNSGSINLKAFELGFSLIK